MSLPFDPAAAKSLMCDGSGLFRLVHQFNVLPAAYAHPSWFEGFVPPDLLGILRKSRRGVQQLSAMLLRRHGLTDEACYDFDYRHRRFALLPAEVVRQLALYCGLAFQHRRLAAVVGRTALERIKTSIGEKAYLFTVKRAPLLMGSRCGLETDWDGRSDFGRFVRHFGAAYFLSHFRDTPAAVAGRLAFKFSRAQAQAAVNRGSDGNGWPLFKRILLHELDPRWHNLFS
jgi:hypothetical protein